jgi:hypothetical protein
MMTAGTAAAEPPDPGLRALERIEVLRDGRIAYALEVPPLSLAGALPSPASWPSPPAG